MTTQEPLHGGAVLIGRPDLAPVGDPGGRVGCGNAPRVEPIVGQGAVAARRVGGAAAGPWPHWAREQLPLAVALAERVPDGASIASMLYREWFNPAAGGVELLRPRRPLAGVYRNAHVGSAAQVSADGVSVVDRHDVVGADGWWRTWGESWTPPRTRPGSVRVLFTPYPDRLADFVRTVTTSLLRSSASWSLGCATNPRRVRRYASAVLDVPGLDALPARLLDELTPTLRSVVPPLCLPVAPGAAVAAYPGNGMTFGEHRCHLIALALRHRTGARDPLGAIAAVFAAHGIDPRAPYRSN